MLQILILYILGPIIHGNVPLRHLSWERERSAFKASIGFLIYETLNQIGQNWKAYCFVDWDCPKINLTKLTCQKGQHYWRVEKPEKVLKMKIGSDLGLHLEQWAREPVEWVKMSCSLGKLHTFTSKTKINGDFFVKWSGSE